MTDRGNLAHKGTMKYFQKIPKEWKSQQRGESCERCGSAISEKEDHFSVRAHWKIKSTADEFQFCSLGCMGKWAEEDSLEQA